MEILLLAGPFTFLERLLYPLVKEKMFGCGYESLALGLGKPDLHSLCH